MDVDYDETARVVLFNICHGALPVEVSIGKTVKTKYITTYVPVRNLNRLIKADTSICSVDSYRMNTQLFTIMRDICFPYTNLGKFFDDDEFMLNCKEQLIPASDDLRIPLPADEMVQTRTGERLSGIIAQSISKSKNIFQYVKSNQGEIIKNKKWGPGFGRGIFIMLPVKFELPYTPTGGLFNQLTTYGPDIRTEYNVYPSAMFTHHIGGVSIENGKYYIRYTEGTNLLTCPYFIEYVLLFYRISFDNIHLYLKMYTIMKENPSDLYSDELLMLTELDAETLYSYFKHVPTINQVDTSCESIYLKHIPKDDRERILSEQELTEIVGHIPTAKLQRLMTGQSITGEDIGRGVTSKNKRRRKSRQTKYKQKKSRKTRKNRK